MNHLLKSSLLIVTILMLSCNNEPKMVIKTTEQTRQDSKPNSEQPNEVNSIVVQNDIPNYLGRNTSNPVRRAIIDAIKPSIEKDLNQKIKFEVVMLNENGLYAFLSARPRTYEGGKINFLNTKYKEDAEEGLMDDNFFALCKKENGQWECLDFMIGCTDVCQLEWKDKYKVSEKLFLDENGNLQ